jgi:phage-related protein
MDWIPVRFFGPARNLIHGWPLEVRKELGSVLTRLQKGETIDMPDVRPMPTIGQQVSEIRIPDSSGTFRALFAIRTKLGILLFHAVRKKSGTTPTREIRTARQRLDAFLKELEEER